MQLTFDRRWLIVLAVIPIFYNPLLAMVNAHVAQQSFISAALSEIIILAAVFFYVFSKGIQRDQVDALFLLLLAFFGVVLALMASGRVYVDFFRNMLIVAAFTLLGRKLTLDELLLVFKIIVSVSLIGLLIEVISLDLYVSIFQPAQYFAATRGNEIAEFNEVGVFGNALGFEGRFGYGLFDGPRTSSIFLEQVTLGNMTIVMSAFVAAFYRYLTFKWWAVTASFVVLSLLSSESRLALLMVLILLFGRQALQNIGKIWLILMPIFFVMAGSVYAFIYPEYTGDTFAGRLSLGFNSFNELKLGDYFGFGVDKASRLMDAGYAYIFCSGTIFGALGFWWFLFYQYRFLSYESVMFFSGLVVFLILALSIGGTAIFSIKVAAFYWLVCGYLSRCKEPVLVVS